MKKFYFTFLAFIFILNSVANGQYGNKQVGLRAGYRSGIFYQIASDAGNAEIAYNAMLGFNNNGIQLTGLRIVYQTVLTEISPDLYFAWGYGGHVGFFCSDHLSYYGERYDFHSDRLCPLMGVDGWLAAEYRFRDIPLNISLNLKPFVELTIPAFVRIMPADIGISISYVF